MKILIADDDKLCRMFLRSLLQGIPGAEVAEAEHGQAAWELLAGGFGADLCISDLMMPVMNGLQLLEKIRTCPATSNLRFALCTTMSDRANVTRAAELRVDSYLLKPFQAELILREVRKARESLGAAQAIESPDAVCSRLGIDRATFDEWSSTLFEDLNKLDGLLEQAVSTGDGKPVAMQVNGSKGASINLGFRRLGDALGGLESILMAQNTPADDWAKQLKAALNGVKKQIDLTRGRPKAESGKSTEPTPA